MPAKKTLSDKKLKSLITELKSTLAKLDLHDEKSSIHLHTNNFSLIAHDLNDCPKECIRIKKVKDPSGKIHVIYYCDCSDD